jgi:hypothetical protein
VTSPTPTKTGKKPRGAKEKRAGVKEEKGEESLKYDTELINANIVKQFDV